MLPPISYGIQSLQIIILGLISLTEDTVIGNYSLFPHCRTANRRSAPSRTKFPCTVWWCWRCRTMFSGASLYWMLCPDRARHSMCRIFHSCQQFKTSKLNNATPGDILTSLLAHPKCPTPPNCRTRTDRLQRQPHCCQTLRPCVAGRPLFGNDFMVRVLSCGLVYLLLNISWYDWR